MTFLFACQRSIDIIINIIAIVLVVVHELNIFIMTDDYRTISTDINRQSPYLVLRISLDFYTGLDPFISLFACHLPNQSTRTGTVL